MENLKRIVDCLDEVDRIQETAGQARFLITSKWEGVILSIQDSEVVSKLYDASTGDYYEHTFNVEDLSEDDRGLVQEGALFYFYDGRSTTARGTQKNDQLIKFRRKVRDRNEVDRILDAINEINYSNLIEEY